MARACGGMVLSALLLAIGGWLMPERAWADVVMPPPATCPPGQVPVTSHWGPRCALEAPRNCPPGWIGRVGGTCGLHLCSDDSQCTDNKRCREQSLCYEEQTHEWAFRGRLRYPAPVKEWVPVGLCPACAPPRECRPGKLCLLPEMSRTEPWAAPRVTGSAGAENHGGAPATTPVGARGCRGCANRSRESGGATWVALCLLVMLRRRR